MRKGAWTLEEVLGTLLVVIAAVFIGIFAKNLYESYSQQNENNAQAFINSLSAKIENLEDGQDNTFALVGINGWVLVGWNKDVPIAKGNEIIGKDRKPQKCFDKSCLCLCETNIANCQQVGYCRNFDRNIQTESKLNYLKTTWSGAVPQSSDEWVNVDSSCINHIAQLMAISVDKKPDKIIVSYDYGSQYSTRTSGQENKILDLLDGALTGNPSSISTSDVERYIEILKNRCN